jgi:hypothetical protein
MADLVAEIRSELNRSYWRLGVASTHAAQVAAGIANAIADQCEAKGQHGWDTVSVDWLLETVATQLGIDTTPRWEVTDVPPEHCAALVVVARYVLTERCGSGSTLQRKFGLRFGEVSAFLGLFEAWGLVGPAYGSAARKVLVPAEQAEAVVVAISGSTEEAGDAASGH